MVKTDFLPSRDGFHFPNKFVNVVNIIGNVSFTTKGRCGGMALASLDYYNSKIPVPTCNSGDFGEAKVPADGTPLADYIYMRLMDSFKKYGLTYLYKHFESDHETLLAGKGLVRETKEDEWPKLRHHLDCGRPVALGLLAYQGGLADCHQVVAYGYTITNGIIKINIYDNNMPDNDNITLESTVDLDTNRRWNEVNNGPTPNETSITSIWRGFFVEDNCPTSESLPVIDLLISNGINTDVSRVCVGDSFNSSFTIKNYGPYNAHLRFPHIMFDNIPDNPNVHGASPVEPPYDNSPTIDLAPGQTRTITQTHTNMSLIGRYRLKARYLPGTKTTSNVNMLPNIFDGAKPATYIEIINKVALYIETINQTQILLYATNPTPMPTPKPKQTTTKTAPLAKTAAAKTKSSLLQPIAATTAGLAKDLSSHIDQDMLKKIIILKSQLSVTGGAYKLDIKAYSTSNLLQAPINYAWRADPSTAHAQNLTGNPVEFTFQVGKTGGPFTYSHQLEVTAIDATGAKANDTFNIQIPTPAATIQANYDDSRNVVGKAEAIPQISSTKAFTKLVIAAQTYGTFGQCTYTWHPITIPGTATQAPQILEDGSKALYTWPLTGNPDNFYSYQNQTVKVTIKDQIGQTFTAEQTIANPYGHHETPVDEGTLPVLQEQFDDPREWITIRDQITNIANIANPRIANARTQTTIQLNETTNMTIKTASNIQVTRTTYGQKTLTAALKTTKTVTATKATQIVTPTAPIITAAKKSITLKMAKTTTPKTPTTKTTVPTAAKAKAKTTTTKTNTNISKKQLK